MVRGRDTGDARAEVDIATASPSQRISAFSALLASRFSLLQLFQHGRSPSSPNNDHISLPPSFSSKVRISNPISNPSGLPNRQCRVPHRQGRRRIIRIANPEIYGVETRIWGGHRACRSASRSEEGRREEGGGMEVGARKDTAAIEHPSIHGFGV